MSVGAIGGVLKGTTTVSDTMTSFTLDPLDLHRRYAILFPAFSTVTPPVTFPASRSLIGWRGRLTR